TPSNWYSQLELAVARDQAGARALAIGPLLAARRLDPSEPIVTDVLADVRGGRPVAVGTLDRAMVGRTDVPRGRWIRARNALRAGSSPIASEAVAPGDGAFRTCIIRPPPSIRKSSASRPSGVIACARIPLGPNVASASRTAGT